MVEGDTYAFSNTIQGLLETGIEWLKGSNTTSQNEIGSWRQGLNG